MVTVVSSGVDVSVALRGECLSAASGTFWRDYIQAPAVPSAGPLWQLSHPVSRFLRDTQPWRVTTPDQHGSTLCLEWQTNKKRTERWLQIFPVILISSVSWSSCVYVTEWNTLLRSVTTSVSLEVKSPCCLWIWKSSAKSDLSLY